MFLVIHKIVSRKPMLSLFNKTNWRTNFPNLFLSKNSTCFGQFLCPSSGGFHCTFGTAILVCHAGLMTVFKHDQVVLENCHQTCMAYTSAECTVENSWWWAEELPETFRVFFWQKLIWEISASVSFIKKKFVTMHGHMNVKIHAVISGQNLKQHKSRLPKIQKYSSS